MIVFAEQLTPRLKYVTAFIGTQLHGAEWELTTDVSLYKAHPSARINYSNTPVAEREIRIEPQGLLAAKDISKQEIDISPDDPQFRFFRNNSDTGFDIFSAVFYLISRYEEYLPHQEDEYGRYAHSNSVAFVYGFLHRPLADEWLLGLKQQLGSAFPDEQLLYQPAFRLLPTYDIDIAWSYRAKGWKRTLGGLARSLVTGKGFGPRLATLLNKKADPFDSFSWLDELHQKYHLKPRYFFLLAGRQGIYDRNNDPSGSPMKTLVRQLSAKYVTGIHPSWRSGDEPGLVAKEIAHLEQLAGYKPDSSRQHYIRFKLPGTYRRLEELGITHDYSMGYGSINGFRASTSFPFYWYDLEKDCTSSVMLHPFCFMDANSYYEQRQDTGTAFLEMTGYYERVRRVNGTMIMIWHNHFLGTDPAFDGWNTIYEEFIRQANTPGSLLQQAGAT